MCVFSCLRIVCIPTSSHCRGPGLLTPPLPAPHTHTCAQLGLKPGTKPFLSHLRKAVARSLDGLKAVVMAQHGVAGADAFVDANLALLHSTDHAFSLPFNRLLEDQKRRWAAVCVWVCVVF